LQIGCFISKKNDDSLCQVTCMGSFVVVCVLLLYFTVCVMWWMVQSYIGERFDFPFCQRRSNGAVSRLPAYAAGAVRKLEKLNAHPYRMGAA